MRVGSKDFYDAMDAFENSCANYLAGNFRFEKPTIEERRSLPPGEWYNHGETNRVFRAFLSGVEYGKTIEGDVDGDLCDRSGN